VTSERVKLGAVQNRLASSIGFTENEIESMTAADSSIRDADVAEEMAAFTRNQIMVESSTAMLAQANQQHLNVLNLVR